MSNMIHTMVAGVGNRVIEGPSVDLDQVLMVFQGATREGGRMDSGLVIKDSDYMLTLEEAHEFILRATASGGRFLAIHEVLGDSVETAWVNTNAINEIAPLNDGSHANAVVHFKYPIQGEVCSRVLNKPSDMRELLCGGSDAIH